MIKRTVTFAAVLVLTLWLGAILMSPGQVGANVNGTSGSMNYLPIISKPAAHDVTSWHPPGANEASHHHGHNPMDTIFADYIAANWEQTLAYP